MLTENPADPLILIVASDSSQILAIQGSFRDAPGGYRLATAASLRAARQAILQLQPNLVLADSRLSDGMGGDLVPLTLDTCPVVLMTDGSRDPAADQDLSAGVRNCIVKSPESFAHLPETAGHALQVWSLVLAHRQAEETLRRYARRLVEIEENLRKKLAEELHDEIGRDLTVLGMNLSIIKSTLANDLPQQIDDRLEDSARLIAGVSRTVRNIMVGLRPPVLDDYGLASALRWHSELFATRTGVQVTVQADELFPRLSPEVELAIFRISQEALMNAAKHAGARIVAVTLECEAGRVRFSVADDGRGTSSPAATRPHGTGWGITFMRERAELAGGTFSFVSQPGQGTVVTVEIPLEDM
ncbi:MAG: histidine kinase [Desulfobacteraceae bacterium]|nr:histidine kinase [Desulfobacteraceae bacterium]